MVWIGSPNCQCLLRLKWECVWHANWFWDGYWVIVATVSSWMLAFESCFHNWNVTEGNSIWLSELQTTGCQNLNIKASKARSNLRRIPNKKFVRYETEGGKKDSKGVLCMWIPAKRVYTIKGIWLQQMLWKVPHGEKGGLKTGTQDCKYLISALNTVHISLVKGFHRDGQ